MAKAGGTGIHRDVGIVLSGGGAYAAYEVGVMRAILIILSAARLDRDFDFVVTGPLDGEQDASIGLVRDQP